MLRHLAMIAGIFLLPVLQHPAVAQQLSLRSYTADQGLPDNEVYRVLPDSRGRLWLATNQGICRFNGYEFVRPVDTSAQRGSEAFLPVEDAQGRIWFARLDDTPGHTITSQRPGLKSTCRWRIWPLPGMESFGSH